jgi:transcriptional regulator with XRE-family HTH domain
LGFWRKKRGLTQGALSKASGVAQGFISEIEAGQQAGHRRDAEEAGRRAEAHR